VSLLSEKQRRRIGFSLTNQGAFIRPDEKSEKDENEIARKAKDAIGCKEL
jgi:hypothetical protein